MKRKKPANHNPRSKEFLLDIEACMTVGGTEHWNSFAHRKQDLFGFCDMIALLVNEIWAVQITSGDNHAKRREKILGLWDAFHWTEAGGKIFILSWTKKKNRWTPRFEEVVQDDFTEILDSIESLLPDF